MVRVKNGTLQKSLEVILELAQKTTSPRMAFKLKSLIQDIQVQYKTYADVRDSLIKEFAEKDEEGNFKFVEGTENLRIKSEGFEKFAELDETEGAELTPLRLSDLNMNFKEMSAMQMFMLGDLVVNDMDDAA